MIEHSPATIRLNKYLAQQGIASRREADTLIAAGVITVNGRPAHIGQQVTPNDTVEVINRTNNKKQYLAYYKARGVISHSPAPGEIDVATKLKEQYDVRDVAPIGRLDKESEGLLLLSNDGRITGPLLDPNAGHNKVYDVTVDKPINHWFIKHMSSGVCIEGYTTKPANLVAHPKNPYRFSLTLTEGKKHQIRRMCAALGYQVQSLKRTQIMHIRLGNLKPNQYRKLSKSEVSTLLATLGVSQ
jgi:23S rRNA pseudouridine2604 synthase